MDSTEIDYIYNPDTSRLVVVMVWEDKQGKRVLIEPPPSFRPVFVCRSCCSFTHGTPHNGFCWICAKDFYF